MDIENQRSASCASASLQRDKDFPAASKEAGACKAQCQAKKMGRARKKVARVLPNASVSLQKQCSFPRHVEDIGNGAHLDPSTVIQIALGKERMGTVR